MNHQVGCARSPGTDNDPCRAVLHAEHQFLRTAGDGEDLCRWRDRLIAELIRPDSPYTRALSPARDAAPCTMPYAVFLDRWARIVTETIQRLQHFGVVSRHQHAEDLATAILAAIHGGVLLARVTEDVQALWNALRLPFEQLIPPNGRNGPG